jgi:hypothetical protein
MAQQTADSIAKLLHDGFQRLNVAGITVRSLDVVDATRGMDSGSMHFV